MIFIYSYRTKIFILLVSSRGKFEVIFVKYIVWPAEIYHSTKNLVNCNTITVLKLYLKTGQVQFRLLKTKKSLVCDFCFEVPIKVILSNNK